MSHEKSNDLLLQSHALQWTLPACHTVNNAGARRWSSVLAQPIRFHLRWSSCAGLGRFAHACLIVLNRLSKRRHGYDAPLTPIGRRLR
jgi:hypothetical protein